MRSEKIDEKLLKVIKSFDLNEKYECLVRTKNNQAFLKYITLFNDKIVKTFSFINSFLVMLERKDISNLSNADSVKYISASSKVFALMNVAKKILKVPQNAFGEGQTICVIDTGIAPHCDFLLCENRIIQFVDFINEKSECYDDNGHGTFVAGVCAGSGVMSGGKFSGIAPKAKIISLKALDKKGEANSEKILDAMQWVFDNRKEISVVCMSFGSDPLGVNDPIMLGAEKLWDNGVVVVAAAGNSGPEFQTIKSPGVSRKIITVGGFNDNRMDDKFNSDFFEMAEFSSRGPSYRYFKPDVIAPAVDIISCGNSKDYVKLSGTSVATPMIAGVCTLIKEKNPNLSPNQVKNYLLSVCKPLFFNRNIEGYGLPNLSKLFNN